MKKVLAIVFLVIAIPMLARNTTTPSQSTTPSQGTAKAEPVRVAAPAVGEKISYEYFKQTRSDMSYHCADAVEKTSAARYGLRGTHWSVGGTVYLRPDRGNTHHRADGHVTFAGDDAEVKTRMGEWLPANYLCEWDPATGTVVESSLGTGLLPK